MDNHYSLVIEWSDKDQAYVVRFPEWGEHLHTHGDTYEEALQAAQSDTRTNIDTQIPSEKKPTEHTIWFHCTLAIMSFVFFAAIASLLGKDGSYDLLNYHFYNGFALFTGAWQRDILPAQIQTFINPEPDLVTYVLIKYFSPLSAGMIMGGLQGLNFWLIFTVSSYVVRFRSHTWLQWPIWFAAAAFGMFTPAAISELGNFMQDLFTAVLVTAGVALALAGLASQQRSPWRMVLLSAAGLSLGFAAGLKLTNAPFAVGAAVAFVPTLAQSRWVQMIVTYVAMAIGFLLGGGYWAWNMWERYGNPFFPFFNALFKSPYARPINVSDPRFFPKTLTQWLLYPFYFRLNTPAHPLELPVQDFSIAACLTLVFVAAAVGLVRLALGLRNRGPVSLTRPSNQQPYSGVSGNSSPTARDSSGMAVTDNTTELIVRLMIFGVISYVLWELLFANYRYLTPLVILSPVLIAGIAALLVREERVVTVLVLALFLCIAATSVHYDWNRIVWGNSYFGIQAPQISNPSRTLILMNTGYVDAYMIAEFPEAITVIRIESGGEQLYTAKFDAIVQARVDSFRGSEYLLTAQVPGLSSVEMMISHANQTLSMYGREVEPGSCRLIPVSVEASPTYLCRVQTESPGRKSGSSPTTRQGG